MNVKRMERATLRLGRAIAHVWRAKLGHCMEPDAQQAVLREIFLELGKFEREVRRRAHKSLTTPCNN